MYQCRPTYFMTLPRNRTEIIPNTHQIVAHPLPKDYKLQLQQPTHVITLTGEYGEGFVVPAFEADFAPEKNQLQIHA